MRILIVDDLPLNRKLLRVTLEAEGHTTLEAVDGIDALQTLTYQKVDAIISDIFMPNMDGFRFCQEIRRNETLRALPFIVYTSTYTSAEDMKLAESIGADKYLIKPAPTEAVITALQEVMNKKAGHSTTTGAVLTALQEVIDQRAAQPASPASTAEETYVLKQYSQVLVNKLEEKNAELLTAVGALQTAHDRIARLNTDLERRVQERTAELEAANRELTQALADVKELSELLPICSYCKKVRDDQAYWHTVEGYLRDHAGVKFSHGTCPECFEKHVKPDLEKHGVTGVRYSDE
jgi:CheY-like chemotaxis protein